MMQLVNLTPHPIVIRRPNGAEIVIPPSGTVARVSSTPGVLITEDPVPIYSAPSWGPVEGLPDPADGTVYVVSTLGAARVPHRTDVVSPGTGPQDGAVRDENGKIVAVTRFVSAAPHHGRDAVAS